MSPETEKQDNEEFWLPEDIRTLPPVCQREIRSVLRLLAEIQYSSLRIGLYTKLLSLVELGKQFDFIREHAQGVFDGLRPFKFETESDSWAWALEWASDPTNPVFIKSTSRQKAADRAAYLVDVVLIAANRPDPWSAPWWLTIESDQFCNRLDDQMWRGSIVDLTIGSRAFLRDLAKSAIGWATSKDQPLFEENPFLHLLQLRRLGRWGYGFRRVTNEGEKLILHPFLRRTKVACLAFADHEEPRKTKTAYIHRPNVACLDINGRSSGMAIELPTG